MAKSKRVSSVANKFANLKIGRAEKFDFDPRLISYPPI